MNNKLKTIILIILFLFIMPIVSAYIIVKLFVNHNGKLLGIIFISLIILEISLSIYKIVKYKKNKK